MNRLVFALVSIGLAAFALTSFVALSVIGLFGVAALTVVGAVRSLIAAPQPQPAYARVKPQNGEQRHDGVNRVWNDGRGTIIDM